MEKIADWVKDQHLDDKLEVSYHRLVDVKEGKTGLKLVRPRARHDFPKAKTFAHKSNVA